MKHILLLFILLLSLPINAQFGYQPERKDRMSNTLGFDPMNAFVGGKKDNQGVRRNATGLAFKGGFNLNANYWEFGMHINTFQHIHYYAMGMSFHRELITIKLDNKFLYNNGSTLAFLIGGEAQIAARYGLSLIGTKHDGIWKDAHREYFNYSISGITRYDRPFGLPLFLEAQLTFTQRSDIKDLWGDNSKYTFLDNPNGYIKFGFYFIELFNIKH